MLKFQRNRTNQNKLEFYLWPHFTLLSWKLNGNIFLELFLGDLDEKMTSAGYKSEQNKKKWSADTLFNFGRYHRWVKKAYFWIISVLEASSLSQITFCIFTNFLNSISERSGPIFWTSKHFPYRDGHYGGFHTNLLSWQSSPDGM